MNVNVHVRLENVLLIWRRHHCRWRALNFELCSTLMAIEQTAFLSVPHPLCHGTSFYNGHLRGPVTLTPIAFGSDVTTFFYDLGLLRLGFEHPISAYEANALITAPPPRVRCSLKTKRTDMNSMSSEGRKRLKYVFLSFRRQPLTLSQYWSPVNLHSFSALHVLWCMHNFRIIVGITSLSNYEWGYFLLSMKDTCTYSLIGSLLWNSSLD